MFVSLPIFCSCLFSAALERLLPAKSAGLMPEPRKMFAGFATCCHLLGIRHLDRCRKCYKCEEPGPAETEELQGQTEAKAGKLESPGRIPNPMWNKYMARKACNHFPTSFTVLEGI